MHQGRSYGSIDQRGTGVAPSLPILLLALLAPAEALAAQPGVAPPISSVPSAMLEDAELADLFFIDAQRGWAVGDRGVIWHTTGGGEHWHRQDSTVNCRLESVFFLDDQHGWAVGGFTQPYTHVTQAVILRTRDGGATWKRDTRPLLPALRKIRFFDEARGWALGETSALYPSGVFLTDDGGRSWTGATGDPAQSWLTGDFISPETGALAGRAGSLAAVRQSTIEPAGTPPFGMRGLRAMKLDNELGWLVGDGGLIASTEDAGRTWQLPSGELPDQLIDSLDLHALATCGTHVWAAGSPGTRIVHSADGGRTWHAYSTGQKLPIRALHFIDEQHGWAACALGNVLATRDGGQTWQRQRSGGTRSAVLGLFSEPTAAPLELFARLSGDEGYLGVAYFTNRRDLAPGGSGDASLPARAHEALVSVGGSGAATAWRFPLREAGLHLPAEGLLDGWNRANDGAGLKHLESDLVRQIRIWRPEVVVTHAATPDGSDPLGHLINQVVLRAVEAAADPTSHADQIITLGLEPWQVKKVYGAAPDGQSANLMLVTSQFAPRLGRTLAEVAESATGLLTTAPRVAPEQLGFRSYVDRIPQEQGRRDFMSGIALQPGGEARRASFEASVDAVDRMRRLAQKQRNLSAIIDRSGQDVQLGNNLLAQVGNLTADLDDHSAGHLLFNLANHYHAAGQWNMAAETMHLLAEKHPEHRLAPSALLWLVQYWSSGEAAWREQRQQRITTQQVRAEPQQHDDQDDVQTAVTDDRSTRFGVRQASNLAIDLGREVDRHGQALELGKLLQMRYPTLYSEPVVQFPLAIASRQQGSARSAERALLAARRSRPHDAWWECAEAEFWLADRGGIGPKPVWHAVRARGKPLLDGRLDEPIWKEARPAQLKSPLQDDAAWRGAAMLAYDEGFLYLAVSCRKVPGLTYPAGTTPRPRDPDLSAHDRVEVLVDVDRDWSTYYRLTVDHRGWTGESCWGDSTWDPAWYVAADETDTTWTVEAAIPLDELTGSFPRQGTAWAVGAQRVVPGVGFQSWSTPAAPSVIPEGFGLLIFD